MRLMKIANRFKKYLLSAVFMVAKRINLNNGKIKIKQELILGKILFIIQIIYYNKYIKCYLY